MKLKLLLSAFILMLVSALAFSQPHVLRRGDVYPAPNPRERTMSRAMGGHRGDIYRICINAGIYLTDAQLKEMRQISYEYELKINDLEYQRRSIEYKFKFEKEKIDLDLNLMKDLISQRKDLEKEIDYLRIEKDVSVLDVLTEEQMQQLNSYKMRYYR